MYLQVNQSYLVPGKAVVGAYREDALVMAAAARCADTALHFSQFAFAIAFSSLCPI
jgi:hypothetical protein